MDSAEAEDSTRVTYDEKRRKYVVSWRENGRRRVRRFATPEQAHAFQRTHAESAPATEEPQNPEVAALERRLAQLEAKLAVAGEQTDAPGDSVFPYETKQGPDIQANLGARRGPPTRLLVDGHGRARRGGRARAEDRPQHAHVPERRGRRGRAPKAAALEPVRVDQATVGVFENMAFLRRALRERRSFTRAFASMEVLFPSGAGD